MSIWRRIRPAPKAYETGVLMVCMGNICRSPMAEGVLRHKLARLGLDHRVEVDSAGTHGDRGAPADPRAVAAAARRGYDLTRLRSRKVTDADFERFEHVVVMDEDNRSNLLERCPQDMAHRITLLLDLSPRSDLVREIPDPYYGTAQGFDLVLDLIEPACDRLIERLRQRLDSPR
ncbi:low molecular weight protein-tyrosine-phosphatase [Ideonella sp. A 288]|uniref:low molecular weight protein-tyrosine-phosphatase n=1 Tax=Ideonella sp. A 288 TaxID=1962181 RepID=UPI000B4C0794|nr:low molecular weight protein-tyrosine-phosphatase [Ideonella sp. A 288]